MHVVTGIFAFNVPHSGTFTCHYPTGTVQSDFTGSSGHVLLVDQAPLSEAGSEISLSFGASSITVTNLTTRTLRAGERFWLQLEPYALTDGYLIARRGMQPRDLVSVTMGSGVTLAGHTLTGTGGAGGSANDLTLTVAELKALTTAVAGDLQFVYDATYGWSTYHYKAGTDAESAPDIYRPDNYAAVTNEFVWERA